MIIDIFKTSIYKTSLENKEYIDYFYNIIEEQKKLYNLNYISNVGGFQTKPFNIVNNKNIYNDVFINPALEYMKQFNKTYDVILSNFWINSNNKNDYNLLHNHNDSNISGVYYIKVPENSGRIVFQNGDLGKMNSKNQYCFDDPNFYSRFFFPIKQYDLILFSSDIFHYVEPNRSNDERISVAFNIDIINN
jgi:uncharacterized protein (TIGR02466 family)